MEFYSTHDAMNIDSHMSSGLSNAAPGIYNAGDKTKGFDKNAKKVNSITGPPLDTQPKLTVSEAKRRCENVFNLLKAHPAVGLFTKPLDVQHPNFSSVAPQYLNLNNIEQKFK